MTTARPPLIWITPCHQSLNVALGGTLSADNGLEVQGALQQQRMDRKDKVVHKVALTPDSILTKMAGTDTLGVNSSHHQAEAPAAKPLRVTAASPDGIIEGLELATGEAPGLPDLLGVQFHPERMFEPYSVVLDLFRSFTHACNRRRR